MAKPIDLGFFGALCHEKLVTMSDSDRKAFVASDVKDVLGRRTSSDMVGPIILSSDMDTYAVSARYKVIDSRLNVKGTLYAELTVRRSERKLSVTLNNISLKS